MKVTIAICTWNRASLLDRTLKRICDLTIPENVSWELFVANNNSTDNTSEVVDQYSDLLPIRKLSVQQQGQCHCRNAIIEIARGDWILWIDDDVLVEPNWMVEYLQAICENPGASFMGGSIKPWFETKPPAWLNRHFAKLEGAFAVTPAAQKTRQLNFSNNDTAIFGANMAFRTDVMKQFRFDTNLGLVGDQPMRGDETELIMRLESAGYKGLWVGGAKVEHFIPTRRMTTKYLREFFYGCGQAQIRMAGLTQVPTVFGRPRWAVKAWIISSIAAILLTPLKNSSWLHHYSRAATCLGIIDETKKQSVKRSMKIAAVANS